MSPLMVGATKVGSPQAPAVRYSLRWANAAVSQTTGAGVAAVDITAQGTFSSGLAAIIEVVLQAPDFLYRIEQCALTLAHIVEVVLR